MTNYIEDYCARVKRGGAAAVIDKPVQVARSGHYCLNYVPFEHENEDAQLILVSTTPGHTHVKLAAYLTAAMLKDRQSGRVIQREHKRQIELGGPMTRPNLIRMLDHFDIPELVGAASASQLWESEFHRLQSLAMIPHAATRRGLTFDGSLDELLAEPILRDAFETQFLSRMRQVREDALFVALGRTAWAGLQYAADQGIVPASQLLGMMPVPARAGSMVRYFLREVEATALSKNDPVRHRVAWLDEAHETLSAGVRRHRDAVERRARPSTSATATAVA